MILVWTILPIVVFLIAGAVISRLSGRAPLDEVLRAKGSSLLALRIKGYDIEAVRAHLDSLDPKALAALRRWTLADLSFPLFYGTALIFSFAKLAAMVHLWDGVRNLFIALVALTASFDWVENTIHLRLIADFERSRPLSRNLVRVSSFATQAKIALGLICQIAPWFLLIGLASMSFATSEHPI